MADWYGHARSNYFRVKDDEAFRAAIAPLGDLEIVEGGDGTWPGSMAGAIALLVTGADKGDWPTMYYDEEKDEDIDVDVPTLVSEHLVDGDVAVFMECGAEKLRYLTGWACAINAAGERVEISINEIYERAGRLGSMITEVSY